jgi:hypothetical protein
MRILITNNHLVEVGGSETWTRAMAAELAHWHDVTVFALELGPFADTLSCPVVSLTSGAYDLALVNHNTCLEAVQDLAHVTIQTCHGVYPALEQPAPGADAYVAVSEEVAAHLRDLGYPGIREGRPRVLSTCQTYEGRDTVAAACDRLGLEFDYVHVDRRVVDVETYMNRADLVVGLGRSAYEAMACGRSVLVFDQRAYMQPMTDGLVGEENIGDLLACNLSGRALAIPADAELIAGIIQGYDGSIGMANRRFAALNLNIRIQAMRYMELYRQVVQFREGPA